MAAALLATILPLVVAEVGKLIEHELAELQKQYPGSTPFQALEKTIEKLLAQHKILPELAQRLHLANAIARISKLSAPLVHIVDANPAVNSLRDFAVHFDTAAVEKALKSSPLPPPVIAPQPATLSTTTQPAAEDSLLKETPPDEKFSHFEDAFEASAEASAKAAASVLKPKVEEDFQKAATFIRAKIFKAQPTGTVQGMVLNNKLGLATSVKDDLLTVLQKIDDKAIGMAAVPAILAKNPEVLKAIPSERHDAITGELKMISRVASISPTPKAMETLVNKGLTTSLSIASLPKAAFVSLAGSEMTTAVASQVHDNALATNFRNENTLVGLLQMVKGSGLAVIDGHESAAFRILQAQKQATAQGYDLNLENLFGSMDQPVYDESTTVYGAASYFVELLQYLRHSAADGSNANVAVDTSREGDLGSIKGTVLEKLFQRRPDLGNLQLTAENTDTVLPYVDLSNEIMESFIVNMDSFASNPRQTQIDVFNVGSQDSTELLSQPQNINYDAYQSLASAVYPFTLPYHQPIDAQRTFLGSLNVPRSDLLRVFREKAPGVSASSSTSLTPEEQAKQKANMQALQKTVLDRQADAELLGLVQEQYLILTKEVFFSKEFFEATENLQLTADDYHTKIGLQPVYQYWGYSEAAEMTLTDPTTMRGLQFVKKQLLPRAGIAYSDLIDLVLTRFLNPLYPQGRNRTIFEKLRFSYQFLVTLVEPRTKDPKRRYGKLAEFLVNTTNILNMNELLADKTTGVAPPQQTSSSAARQNFIDDDEIRKWVLDNFEDMGKILVLDSGEGPYLPIEGEIIASTPGQAGAPPQETSVGTLRSDGSIVDGNGEVFAHVTIGGQVLVGSAVDGLTLDGDSKFAGATLFLRAADGKTRIASISQGYLLYNDAPVQWILNENMGGTSSIEDIRLIHLDGTPLSMDEWDKIHRFIRLWRVLGWSVGEVDMVLMGQNDVEKSKAAAAAAAALSSSDVAAAGNGPTITLDHFGSKDHVTKTNDGPNIGVETIRQLAAMKKLLPLTGLSIEQLSTFWTDIPTRDQSNQASLYSRLFFTGNIIRKTDPIFGPDLNGDYFTTPSSSPPKITDNALVISAAFNIRPGDIEYLVLTDTVSPKLLPDVLNLENLSKLYRYSLLARVLSVGISDLRQVLQGFEASDPFSSPVQCLKMLDTWGKMDQVDFTWQELRYIASDVDSPLDPLSPSRKTVLETSKTLHDGIISIQEAHQMPASPAQATEDLVKTKLSLYFNDNAIAQILMLLNGETLYNTLAPTVTDPDFMSNLATISARIVYIPAVGDSSNAKLQIKGILTEEEIENAMSLLDVDPEPSTLSASKWTSKAQKSEQAANAAARSKLREDWKTSLQRAVQQPRNIFFDCLSGIFPPEVVDMELSGKKKTILAPDTTDDSVTTTALAQSSISDSSNVFGQTPTAKRVFFLTYFLPFLKQSLARVFIEDTISSAVGFTDRALAKTMLENIAINPDSSPDTPIDILMDALKTEPSDEEQWAGYITPASSDYYIFLIERDGSEPPPSFILDGIVMSFTKQQEDPHQVWATQRTASRLDSGQLYSLEILAANLTSLEWKSNTGVRSNIPTSAFLPQLAERKLYNVFVNLQKLAILVNHLKLSSEEVIYINDHRSDFSNVQFNNITIKQWERLETFVVFRSSLPVKTEISLIDFFNWAVNSPEQQKDGPSFQDELAQQISLATAWDKSQISQVLQNTNLTTENAVEFRNEALLVRFQEIITLANKIGVAIPRLFSWASPLGTSAEDFFKLHDVAEDIQRVARSRYNLSDWPDVVRPLNDVLRDNQKTALISYLLVQNQIRSLNISDADGLFDFFLIDLQMGPLVETSRIKQAIATVQVYVQRCLLGLEDPYGVVPSALDRGAWDWMQRYRVWEANRKVFLYPENWIEPSLRDDKSDLFKALESELLQKDLNDDVVSGALKSFVCNVSEFSNMVAAGICVDTDGAAGDKIHLFSHTRYAPYTYYYISYANGNWTPWVKMAIEIPTYTATNNSGQDGATGAYLYPVMFHRRLIVFIPQIMKKTLSPANSAADMSDVGKATPDSLAPKDMWEIKLSWTEFRNGAWTARKLCPDGFIDATVPQTPIDRYNFFTMDKTSDSLSIWCSIVTALSPIIGGWRFGNDQLSLIPLAPKPRIVEWSESLRFTPPVQDPHTSFGYTVGPLARLHSTEALDTPPSSQNSPIVPKTYDAPPFVTEEIATNNSYAPTVTLLDNDTQQLYNTAIGSLMPVASPAGTDDIALFTALGSVAVTDADMTETFGFSPANGSFNERARPYSIYNWELGLHAPMILVDRLLKAQQFEKALDVCHYVFNPMATGDKKDMSRFWVFAPFKRIKTQTVESLFMNLRAGVADANISDWRAHPFQPHVVARGRPEAYMKWMVMKYIEILIAWGDYYFRQNTLETIPNAIQMYILASHLYGPRGQKVTRTGKVKPYTYNALRSKFDAFSNAMVAMEESFPFSNQTPLPIGKLPDDAGAQITNIFGFAGTLFFAIPDNPNLRAFADQIDDRLFKIRHSQDINGVFRQLPLFEPPIDPALLVQAAASGLSLSSVLADLNGPMPNYRFAYLLHAALDLASEVKSFGQALLLAREKQDSETFAVLQAKHSIAMQTLAMSMKKLALDEANKNLESLQYSRKGPVSRMQFYLQQAGEELSAVPAGTDTEFQELNAKLQTPVDEGGLKLLPSEKEDMTLRQGAEVVEAVIGALETVSGVFQALPTTAAHATPLGVGAAVKWGPPNIGQAIAAAARGVKIGSDIMRAQADSAGSKAMALRSLNDRLLQANIAGYEISAIDKQIIATKIRVAMANNDIDMQQTAIDQAQEIADFFKSKYSTVELYSWIAAETRTLYYGAYKQAYDLAKKVEKVLQFERPQLAQTSFIQPGYWDTSRDGLLAGEKLYCALKQLESTYMEQKGYDYEITKNISLRQIDPAALMALRETGTCTWDVPEILFDMDFPGHYLRRITSIALTIPCVIGPYASVNATLRLTANKFRANTQGVSSASTYPEVTTPGSGSDDRFATTNVPISAVAMSTAQADSGVFELNFRDERYLPFEGAGAISSWSLELPQHQGFRPFNYSTINDVILQMRYTAVEGGVQVKTGAMGAVTNYIKAVEYTSWTGGLFAVFDVKNEFASGWTRFLASSNNTTSPPPAGANTMDLADLDKKLPLYTLGRAEGSIKANAIWLLTDAVLPDGEVKITDPMNKVATLDVQNDPSIPNVQRYTVEKPDVALGSWKLSVPWGKIEAKRMWLIFRYVLT